MGGTMDYKNQFQQIGIYEQWNPWPSPGAGAGRLTPQPISCSGDVHVFPCPHCEKCKCGKATVNREATK